MWPLRPVPRSSIGLLALAACALVSRADVPVAHVVGFDTTVLEDEYCARPVSVDGGGSAGDMNTATMSCSKLMEFVYVSRLKVKEKLEILLAAAKANETESAEWMSIARTVSRAQSFLSAHMHVVAALATQRPGCFSENMKLLLTMSLRRMKPLVTGQLESLWLVTQSGPDQAGALVERGLDWLSEAAGLVDADLTLKSVLATWSEPSEDEARFFSHEADGRYSTLEALRRDTFDEFVLDRGLLRALLQHVLQTGATVADIGAGSGHYAKWLNDTGLVSAYAFDGTPEVELVTRGSVLGIDLSRPLGLWQKFDWVLCLEVATSIPPELTPMFLQNLDRHAGEGLVISWTQPGLRALGSPNPRSQAEVLALVKEHTGLHLSEDPRAHRAAAGRERGALARRLAAGPDAHRGPGCRRRRHWCFWRGDIWMRCRGRLDLFGQRLADVQWSSNGRCLLRAVQHQRAVPLLDLVARGEPQHDVLVKGNPRVSHQPRRLCLRGALG
ncbi:unnamed protein product, partial [Prorocentrum cordatum]